MKSKIAWITIVIICCLAITINPTIGNSASGTFTNNKVQNVKIFLSTKNWEQYMVQACASFGNNGMLGLFEDVSNLYREMSGKTISSIQVKKAKKLYAYANFLLINYYLSKQAIEKNPSGDHMMDRAIIDNYEFNRENLGIDPQSIIQDISRAVGLNDNQFVELAEYLFNLCGSVMANY